MTEPKYQIDDRLYLANLPVKIILVERSQDTARLMYLYVVSFDCLPEMVTLVQEQDLWSEPQLPSEDSVNLSDWLDD
jgi:hypothetical protein